VALLVVSTNLCWWSYWNAEISGAWHEYAFPAVLPPPAQRPYLIRSPAQYQLEPISTAFPKWCQHWGTVSQSLPESRGWLPFGGERGTCLPSLVATYRKAGLKMRCYYSTGLHSLLVSFGSPCQYFVHSPSQAAWNQLTRLA
jgi:hypothetical protein